MNKTNIISIDLNDKFKKDNNKSNNLNYNDIKQNNKITNENNNILNETNIITNIISINLNNNSYDEEDDILDDGNIITNRISINLNNNIIEKKNDNNLLNRTNPIVSNKNEILSLLIKKQLPTINVSRKLCLSDLKRIVTHLPIDIFTDNCCIWSGYITNLNKNNKNCYISFFFKNKKIALHRLLYYNFVDILEENEYLKFTCNNKGTCCTLKHLKKFCIEPSSKYYNKTILNCDKNNDNEHEKEQDKNNNVVENKINTKVYF